MDDFEKFWMEVEREELGVEPDKLETILIKILAEFNLELKSVKETEKGDKIGICTDRLGRDVTSIIRIRTDKVGVDKDDVEDLYEYMVEKGHVNAIFITTSHFFNDAREFIQGLPVRLLDGVELAELIAEIDTITVEKAFVSEIGDEGVVNYFQRRIKKKFLGKIGITDTIEKIDRRYLPLGFLSIRVIEETVERRKFAYVDLSSGDLFYIDAGQIKKHELLKKLLELPEGSREHLLDLIEHGELPHEHMDGKHLAILKKRGLVGEYREDERGGIVGTITGGIMGVVRIITDVLGSLVGIPQSGYSTEGGTSQQEKYVRANVNIPIFDQAYNLEKFMEVSGASEEFDPDPIKYKAEDVVDILKRITGHEVAFKNMIQLPYYLCKYSGPGGERYRRLYSLKFKEFFPRPGTYSIVYHIIDKFPELPYLILAALYVGQNFGKIEEVTHILSSAVIFIIICAVSGTLLKAVFKTERTTPYYGVSVFRYGFPSMHSLASIGVIGFVYFIEPMGPLFALILIPVGLLYIYSRIRIGAHSVTDVIGGAVIGIILGIICGMHLLSIYLPYPLELIFASFLVIMPFIFMIIRVKYIH